MKKKLKMVNGSTISFSAPDNQNELKGVMTNQDKLRQLMTDNNLTRLDIADISGYSLHSINAFLLPITSKAHRRLSNRTLEAISLKIGSRVLVEDKEP